MAQVVVAHLTEQKSKNQLPPKHMEAEEHRPKLVSLNEEGGVRGART